MNSSIRQSAPTEPAAAMWLQHTLLLLLCLLVLGGCARSEDSDSSGTGIQDPVTQEDPVVDPPVNDPPSNPPMSDAAAFSLHLHPVLIDTANGCVGCHADTQDPAFANAGAQAAYDVVIAASLVNLSTPDGSMLYQRPAMDRHNCGDDANCDQIAAAMLAGIQAWAAEVANPPPPPQDPPEDEMPPPVDPDPPMDPPPMTDVMVFESTLYPLLRDAANFCVSCHGVAQIPAFAVEDVVAAYNTLISQQKVDLDNPANSRIYLRPSADRHNCGGETSCDAIAAVFLAGIQDWADQRVVEEPPVAAIKSAAVSMADAQDAAGARVEDAVFALFTFEEGTGNTATDTSGVGTPIVLQLEGTTWEPNGGLRNVSGKAQASLADSQKLFNRISASGEYTVEAWVTADNNDQDGPARIVSYSLDTGQRNFTMGQNALYYVFRNRSANTGNNGTPQLEALQQEVSTALQHVTMTFDPANGRRIFVDGQLLEADNQADTLAWNDQQIFLLGNEVTNNRLWQGVFHMVAMHDRALSQAEVAQNFDVGLGTLQSLRFDLTAMFGANAYIDMLFQPVSSNGYMFAEPRFGGDVSGVTVKNIRIAVNDSIPVAAQAFRRVDNNNVQPGTLLSPLGAVIPTALGADQDQFHLEFEVLGNNLGLAEDVAPALPPTPLPDVEEPDIGVRSFSQLNDTMSAVTGVDANNNTVRTLYEELQGQLPANTDVLSFNTSHQVAIQRLATGYCQVLVGNNGTCNAFFGSCDIDAAGKDAVSDVLFDNFVGNNIGVQPAKDAVRTEIVSLIDDLGCANGCVGDVARTTLGAACAAVLSNSALTVN